MCTPVPGEVILGSAYPRTILEATRMDPDRPFGYLGRRSLDKIPAPVYAGEMKSHLHQPLTGPLKVNVDKYNSAEGVYRNSYLRITAMP